jgi:hypothetical protein
MLKNSNPDFVSGSEYREKLIDAFDLLEKGGFDKNLLLYNGRFQLDIMKKIYRDLIENWSSIHLVVCDQILFFNNKILHIIALDGQSSVSQLTKIEVTSLFNFHYEKKTSGDLVIHFTDLEEFYKRIDGVYLPSSRGWKHSVDTLNSLKNLINAFKGEHRSEIFKDLPIGEDGNLEIVDNADFSLLLKEHQNEIIQIDKSYIQKFVKISSFLKEKKENITTIFYALSNASDSNDLEKFSKDFRKKIYLYELVFLHAVDMLSALIDQDMVAFFEAYEIFDGLEIFESNSEKSVREKLSTISDKIDVSNRILAETNRILAEIFYQNQKMEQQIVGAINNLAVINAAGFARIENRLTRVNSTLKVNTLINAFQAYQTYRLTKN